MHTRSDCMIINFILVILVIAGILFILFRRNILTGIRLAKNTFACPNCGHHFKIKWYNLIFAPSTFWEKAYVKCPKCHIRDTCTIPIKK